MESDRQTIGWQPYAYLAVLGILLFHPIFSNEGLSDWLWTGALIAAFLPVYLASFRVRGWLATAAIAWMTLLGVVSLAFPLNTGGAVFFIYAAAAPHAWSTRGAVRFIVGLLVVVAILALISPVPMPYRVVLFLPAFIFVPLIGGQQIFDVERERSNAKLRQAHDEVEHIAAVAERERIGRDLHDLLGHTLSVIRVKSELAGRLVEIDPARAKAEIDGVEQTAREALAEVRAAVQGYRSTGLTGEVVSSKLALEAAGVAFSFRADPDPLPPRIEAALGFVLREAVTNIVRHAGASLCTATVEVHEGRVALTVHDNGVGTAGQEGNGLSNLRERIRALGGDVSLTSEPGQGLAVRAWVPLPESTVARATDARAPGPARLEPT